MKHFFSHSIAKYILVILLSCVLSFQLEIVSVYAQTSGGSTSTQSATASQSASTGSGGSRTSTSCAITKVGDPQTSPPPLPADCLNTGGTGGGPPGACQEAPPPPADIRAAVIAKWGIVLDITAEQLPWAWKEFHQIDCYGFLQDIKGAVVGSWANGYAQQFGCPSDPGADVLFSNQWNGEYMMAILSHELTHVWQFCSSRGEQNRAEIPPVYQSEGGLTNYSRTGCSFDVDLYNEDHADTIALYMNPWSGELTCAAGGNPFAGGAHPQHYNLAKRGLGR